MSKREASSDAEDVKPKKAKIVRLRGLSIAHQASQSPSEADAATGDLQVDDEGNKFLDLGSNRRVTIGSYKKKINVRSRFAHVADRRRCARTLQTIADDSGERARVLYQGKRIAKPA